MLRRFLKWLRKLTGDRDTAEEVTQEEWENPYLEESRLLIEQILTQKNLDYRRFRPIILDTDRPNQNFGEPDDVDLVLEQLEEGLNFLEICTDRPEHFLSLQERAARESGLLVRLLPGHAFEQTCGNMVLDFERCQPMWMERFAREVIYLPFYKRRWVPETAENGGKSRQDALDIGVPIGYNMMNCRRNYEKTDNFDKFK